ncbi:MAG: cupin domain-containing protein, partial [Lysobacter sp.]
SAPSVLGVIPEIMIVPIKNLFVDAEASLKGERFETLLAHKNLVIERIVSSATVTPIEYVQPQDEWVAMLRGEATLELAGETIQLHSGDFLFLPASTPHTVRRVSDGALWLAVHLHP